MVAMLALSVAVSIRSGTPPLAKIAGIVLGQTTIEQFEKVHGKGLALPAGMTKSGRHMWYEATTGAELSVDGWFRSREGQIIDTVNVHWVQPGLKSLEIEAGPGGASAMKKFSVPAIRLSKSELGVLALLHPGMSRHDVNSVSPVRLDDNGHLVSHGKLEYAYKLKYIGEGKGGSAWRFTKWTIWCLFDGSTHELYGLMTNVEPG